MQHQPLISRLGSPFIELIVVDSTNNYALTAIRKGSAGHGAAFFSHEQTGGKGRMGRHWLSEKGVNIALSVVIQPKSLNVSQQFQLSACVATAVQHFLASYAGDDIKIKWPNDLYWQNRKMAGILIENIVSSSSAPGNWQWAVAGIGVNMNQTAFPPTLTNAVSLKQVTGKKFDIVQAAHELCSILNSRYTNLADGGFKEIFNAYNHCLFKWNETVKLKKDNIVFETEIKGVSEMGELITHNGKSEARFSVGEVTFIL